MIRYHSQGKAKRIRAVFRLFSHFVSMKEILRSKKMVVVFLIVPNHRSHFIVFLFTMFDTVLSDFCWISKYSKKLFEIFFLVSTGFHSHDEAIASIFAKIFIRIVYYRRHSDTLNREK